MPTATAPTTTASLSDLFAHLPVYADRAREDRRLLTYTSAPLMNDLEVTGYPVIHL